MGIAWTDEETGLLLSAVIAFKNEKSVDGLNWNAIRSKYEDIHQKFVSLYMERNENIDEFPNRGDPAVFTKAMIMGKIKRIKNSYREALRRGKRTAGGRIVYQYYDDCVQIWDTAPPVEPISSGIETSSGHFVKFQNDADDISDQYDDSEEPPISYSCSNTIKEETHMDEQRNESPPRVIPPASTAPFVPSMPKLKRNNKRPFFSSRLNKRTDDTLLLQAIKEEREFKKQCLELLTDSNRELKTSTREFMENMNSISRSMNEGFTMIRNIMTQQFLIQSYNFPTNDLNQNAFDNPTPSDLPANSQIVIPTSPSHDASALPDHKESSEVFTFRINREKLS